MTADHLDTTMEMERRSFRQPWSRRMYMMDLYHNPLATYLVVLPDPADQDRLPGVLAYGGFWLMVDEAHIATIASHPELRGCGLGKWLLLALLDQAVQKGARCSTLEVRASNSPARQLYLSLGYGQVGERRRYYEDGEDAIIMTTPSLQSGHMLALLAQQRQAALRRLRACFGDEALAPDSGDAPDETCL